MQGLCQVNFCKVCCGAQSQRKFVPLQGDWKKGRPTFGMIFDIHNIITLKKNQIMKIAISSTGSNEESRLDPRFGRCAYFAVYDTESRNIEFMENSAKYADSGAGPAAATFVAANKVAKVISGNFGFKAEDMLNSLHIEPVRIDGNPTIAEVVATLN